MRLFPLLAIAIPLSGCALPPALMIASYAGDAVLMVATDKTSTDHLLSMAEKKDCAMWRVIKGRPICHEWEDGHGPYEKWRDPDGNQVATAGSDAGFTSGMATDSRQNVENGQLIASQHRTQKGGVLLAQAGIDAPVVSAADARRAGGVDRSVQSAPLGAPPPTISASVPPTAAADQSVDNSPSVNDGAPMTQPVTPAAVARDSKPVVGKVQPRPAPVATAAKAPPAKGQRDRYVVIGSYRQHDNAQRVIREHREIKPVVQDVTVRSQHYFRVVAGPYTASQAADIRSSLKQKSHIDAIVAQDCDGKARGGCVDIGG
jgi:hypothetical protein